nr:hypothetical protein GCM10017745_30450 [Saccharothrix mutabilis subsp. capreolus]
MDSEHLVVVLHAVWCLDVPTQTYGRPGDVVRLPIAEAKQLIQQGLAALTDQRATVTDR